MIKVDATLVMYIFYGLGSLCFLAGTLIGILVHLKGG